MAQSELTARMVRHEMVGDGPAETTAAAVVVLEALQQRWGWYRQIAQVESQRIEHMASPTVNGRQNPSYMLERLTASGGTWPTRAAASLKSMRQSRLT